MQETVGLVTVSGSPANMKALQSSKIRELRQALVQAGYVTLIQQAKCLNLSRSSAWAVLQGNHKTSGLSAATVNQILTSHQLPPAAKEILVEYVAEKLAGVYGHKQAQLRKFRARVSANGFVDDRPFARPVVSKQAPTSAV